MIENMSESSQEPFNKDKSFFTRFSHAVSSAAGKPVTFIGACVLIIGWAVSGPLFGFSDTWQLVINTGTTIITFLMVFLIQNTQNRDTAALQLKLDELIISIKKADNQMVDLEDLDDKELARIHTLMIRAAEKGADSVIEDIEKNAEVLEDE